MGDSVRVRYQKSCESDLVATVKRVLLFHLYEIMFKQTHDITALPFSVIQIWFMSREGMGRRFVVRHFHLVSGFNYAIHHEDCIDVPDTFLRRILDTISTVRRPSHKVKLTPAFHEDIAWWRDFIHLFNGTTACTAPAPITTVHIDACNNGSGIAYGSDWQYTHWHCDWPNHRMIIHTDSTTAMAIFN